MAEPSVALFGPLDALVAPYVEYLVLVLVLANLVTRKVANSRYRRQAQDGGADAIARHPLHVATTWLLVLSTLYYTTLHHHSGVVLSTLVLGLFIADFFEFEARKVEAREDRAIESPKGAIVASLLVLSYAAYISVFFVIAPVWNSIV